MLLLKESGKSSAKPPDLFVAVADEGAQDAALEAGRELRREGFCVEFDTRGGSLKSQMKRADKRARATRWCSASSELASAAGPAQADGGRRTVGESGRLAGRARALKRSG